MLNSLTKYIFYEMYPLACHLISQLSIHLPLVEQSAKRHEPNLAFRPSQQGHPVEDQSGKQLFVACPTNTFFEGSSSLST